MPPPRGLIAFDLDGTLFDTQRVTVPAVLGAFDRVGLQPPGSQEILRQIGRPADEFRAWVGSRCPDDRAAELSAAVDELELALVAQEGRLYPGIEPMLETLRKRVRYLLICTNGTQPYVDRVLVSQGIHRIFDQVRYRSSAGDTKPAMLRELLALYPGRPALGVGDRLEDVEAARHCGIASVGAGYGFGSPGELRDATIVVHSPGELLPAIERLLA